MASALPHCPESKLSRFQSDSKLRDNARANFVSLITGMVELSFLFLSQENTVPCLYKMSIPEVRQEVLPKSTEDEVSFTIYHVSSLSSKVNGIRTFDALQGARGIAVLCPCLRPHRHHIYCAGLHTFCPDGSVCSDRMMSLVGPAEFIHYLSREALWKSHRRETVCCRVESVVA